MKEITQLEDESKPSSNVEHATSGYRESVLFDNENRRFNVKVGKPPEATPKNEEDKVLRSASSNDYSIPIIVLYFYYNLIFL